VAHQSFSGCEAHDPKQFSFPRSDGDFSRHLFPNTENSNGKLKLESGACVGGIDSRQVCCNKYGGTISDSLVKR
jgi:hypothetical protein